MNNTTGLKILVVDDDLSIRQLMDDILQIDKHLVTLAECGESAIKSLQSNKFDLLITDLGLPKMSGWELAKMAKLSQSELSIIAISSWRGEKPEKNIGDYGIDLIIRKPFRFQQIKEAIETLINTSPPNRENCS